MQNFHRDRADVKRLVRLEQSVELRTIGQEAGFEVVDVAKHFLHRSDLRTDADLAAECIPEVGTGGEVIRMRVGFQQPLHLQPVLTVAVAVS